MIEQQIENSKVSSSETDPIDMGRVRIEEGAGRKLHNHHSRHSRKRHRRRKKLTLKQIAICVFIVLLVIVSISAAGAYYVYRSGESSIKNKSVTGVLTVADENKTLKEKKNVLKDSMINILLIGVDSKGETGEERIQGTGNGQSDMLMLVSIDTESNIITAIPINRDTMTMITIKDQAGNERGQEKAQIALSYSYGMDNEESAELTVQAVSNLMHGLKIHGYFAVNTSAIAVVNDAVEGVEVVLPEDFVTEWGDAYVKGSKVLLRGSMAEDYVRARSGKQDPTNVARMARQREYLLMLAKKVIGESKKNPALALNTYRKLQPYMTSNIKANEFSYLATAALRCNFSENNICTLKGTIDDSGKYMEFNVDEEQLSQLLQEIYYQEVTQ